ncbi:MAG: hypothetical protein QXO40_04325 [Candidatus Aenigmatarchaeota archaeon]
MKTITEKFLDLIEKKLNLIKNSFELLNKIEDKKLYDRTNYYISIITEAVNELKNNIYQYDIIFEFSFKSLKYLSNLIEIFSKLIDNQDKLSLYECKLKIKNLNFKFWQFIFENQDIFEKISDTVPKLLVEQEEEPIGEEIVAGGEEGLSIEDLFGEAGEEFTGGELMGKTEEFARYAKELELKELTFSELVDIDALLLDRLISEYKILLSFLYKLSIYYISFEKSMILEMIIELVSTNLDHLMKIKEEKIAYPVLSDDSKLFIRSSFNLLKAIYSYISDLIIKSYYDELEKRLENYVQQKKELKEQKKLKNKIELFFDQKEYLNEYRNISSIIDKIKNLNSDFKKENINEYLKLLIDLYKKIDYYKSIADKFLKISQSQKEIPSEKLLEIYGTIFDISELKDIRTIEDLVKLFQEKSEKYNLNPNHVKGLFILYNLKLFPDFIDLMHSVFLTKLLDNKEKLSEKIGQISEKSFKEIIIEALIEMNITEKKLRDMLIYCKFSPFAEEYEEIVKIVNFIIVKKEFPNILNLRSVFQNFIERIDKLNVDVDESGEFKRLFSSPNWYNNCYVLFYLYYCGENYISDFGINLKNINPADFLDRLFYIIIFPISFSYLICDENIKQNIKYNLEKAKDEIKKNIPNLKIDLDKKFEDIINDLEDYSIPDERKKIEKNLEYFEDLIENRQILIDKIVLQYFDFIFNEDLYKQFNIIFENIKSGIENKDKLKSDLENILKLGKKINNLFWFLNEKYTINNLDIFELDFSDEKIENFKKFIALICVPKGFKGLKENLTEKFVSFTYWLLSKEFFNKLVFKFLIPVAFAPIAAGFQESGYPLETLFKKLFLFFNKRTLDRLGKTLEIEKIKYR